MPNPLLVERMRDHLARQIAWYEQLLSELEALDADIVRMEPSEIEERQRIRINGTHILEEEFAILQREWQADARLSPSERHIMRELAQRAEGLATKLIEAHEAAIAAVGEKMETMQRAWNGIRQGQDLLRRYHAGPDDAAIRIDRKA